MKIITLTTDFGLSDPYVAAMKGVILTINSRVNIIDLNHNIAPYQISKASLNLISACSYFPSGTIHVVVVDPGVGSGRRLICAKVERQFFLAPDNGILAPIIEGKKSVIREIKNDAFFKKPVSRTFHARDILGPVAAHLSRKDVFSNIGPRVTRVKTSGWSSPVYAENSVEGKVMGVDRFGNMISNMSYDSIQRHLGNAFTLRCAQSILTEAKTYSMAKRGKPVFLKGSSGFIEIAIRESSAARRLNGRRGLQIKASRNL
jgi:S-adenosyl-L-methionine hydrolase (adenosine-forming)